MRGALVDTLHPFSFNPPVLYDYRCFLDKDTKAKDVKPQARVTSQEVVELARLSLAKGSAPATRAQLFPHDRAVTTLN